MLEAIARCRPASAQVAGTAAGPVFYTHLDVYKRQVLPQAQARGIDLGVLEGDPVVVPGHPDSLAVLLRNLLDNAIKSVSYTHLDVYKRQACARSWAAS